MSRESAISSPASLPLDFERSGRFCAALGFAMSPAGVETADFEPNGHRFRPQDYEVKDWADSFMMVMFMMVMGATTWTAGTPARKLKAQFPEIRIKPPEAIVFGGHSEPPANSSGSD